MGAFDVHLTPNGLGTSRLGVIVTKKRGKANVRNKLKREAREFFRIRRPVWPSGVDMVFIARPSSPEKPPPGLHSLWGSPLERKLVKAMERVLKKARDQKPKP